MMSLWDALRMNMMISYQELVRTFLNLRPGEDTLYWIENGVFQTSVNRVVPYLDNFLSSE